MLPGPAFRPHEQHCLGGADGVPLFPLPSRVVHPQTSVGQPQARTPIGHITLAAQENTVGDRAGRAGECTPSDGSA